MIEVADFGVEGVPSASDGDRCAFRAAGRGQWVAGSVTRRDRDLAASGQPTKLAADLLGCGVAHAVQLVRGGGAGFHRSGARDT
jgi:hypothetical protein